MEGKSVRFEEAMLGSKDGVGTSRARNGARNWAFEEECFRGEDKSGVQARSSREVSK